MDKVKRTITVHYTRNPPDITEVAQVILYHITGGDYEGYLEKIAERERKE